MQFKFSCLFVKSHKLLLQTDEGDHVIKANNRFEFATWMSEIEALSIKFDYKK